MGMIALTSAAGIHFNGSQLHAEAKKAQTSAEGGAKVLKELGYSKGEDGSVKVSDIIYERVDEELFKKKKFQAFKKDHALHETLAGDSMLEKYEIYRRKDKEEIMAVVRFGKSLNGHPKIVHGGITSLVFDNSFGWLFFCLNKPMAVTANLVINYRAPLYQNTTTILRAKLIKDEGRKMFMEATLHEMSKDGVTENLVADSNTLFIKMKLPWYKRLAAFIQNL